MPAGDSLEGSSQSSGPSEFEWELCRENVKPLKSGRRVDAINQALARSACGTKAQTLATQKFDETMELCETSADPLKHCLEFCTWFDQTFPTGRQRLFYSLLWKIIHKYAKCPEYLDDERMLRIWEKLADNSLDHGWEVYQHANTIGSLMRCAALYVRWSQDLEMRGAIADARAVFEDDGDNADNYLEEIFEMDNHIERFSLNEHDSEKWKASKVPLKKLNNCVSSFSVWQDDENKENVDPQGGKAAKKPILKLHKFLIRDMSIEENLASMYERKEDQAGMKKIARKINFDED
ncbi:unnamed protein product [Nippostrongylus brasiliensis]|uniref:BUB1 N-terminal domain-containing protein n=1 Tax=Nippostrongylus brasiliensis TaxID=27835 RepID=A0A158R306_NIPBR|nr:unnamed protein product [Nippostrongylus brasiliensis]